MDKNKKILIGIGAASLFCLCAVGVAYLALRTVGEKFKDAFVTDPDQVASISERIAKYDVPPGYTEQMAMDFGFYQAVMLAPSDMSAKPMIMLMSYNTVGADPDQMREQLQRSFEQQTGTPGITWTTVEERTVTIRGQAVNVVVREGRGENNYAMRQLITAFEGENGTVMVMIQGDAAAWDDDLINEFLTSIQ